MNTSLSFFELAKTRQSDRQYFAQHVEKEKILQCLETTRISPSANNSQPWKFVVVDDEPLKNEIAEAAAGMGMNKWAKQAPVIIAVVLEGQGFLSSIGSVIKDKEFRLLDVGIAVNQFCLQASDMGLGTCILGWFDEKKVKKLLSIPSSKRVPLLITLGYPDSKTHTKSRRQLEEMSSWNKY